jgi:hypothetical protein
MPKMTENLRNAQILTDFSNLEPAQVEYFRNNYPDFVPKAWWDEESEPDTVTVLRDGKVMEVPPSRLVERNGTIEITEEPLPPRKQWEKTQAQVRAWWKRRVKDDVFSLVIMLNSVFDPDPHSDFSRMAEWAVRELYPDGLPEGVTVEIPGREITNSSNLREGYIPMQGAIVYLFENSWRARFCPFCRKRFVAAEPKTKFCSSTCSEEDRRRQKREWFRKHGKQWRKKRQKVKKRSASSLGTGRGRQSR